MIRPTVLFFDFIDTIADISSVSQEEVKAYARKARAIAEGKEPFTPFIFGPSWNNAKIPREICLSLGSLKTICKTVVLTNAPLPFIIRISDLNIEWDAVLCSEIFQQCKPNPKVYMKACELMQLKPRQALMVAAHKFDVEAAKAVGMQGWEIGKDGNFEDLYGAICKSEIFT